MNVDATNYCVVVTNSYGSVTSAMAGLTVFLPLQDFSAKKVEAGIQLQLSGTPGYPYILQSATNLLPPIGWTPLSTNQADIKGKWHVLDTNLLEAMKFYRAVGQQ